MACLSVTHEYTGLIDYWSGNGRRWDDDAGCLFASYSTDTTLRDCVDAWCDDFSGGGDCDAFPEDIDTVSLRAAILESFTDQGRKDYADRALAECATNFAHANGLKPGVPLDEQTTDDNDELPVWIILVELSNE